MAKTPDEAVALVNAFFEYRPDGKLDRWQFKSPGDCENYSLLVLATIYGSQGRARRALLTGKAHIWYCHTLSGNGHAVLEYRGRFTDNRTRRWCNSIDDMHLQAKRRRYSKLELLVKLGFGRF